MEAGLGGRRAVRSFCPSQPVDFRQEKTEMVYSEDALSARFHPRALETLGNRQRRPFSRCGLSLCFLWPAIYFNEHFFLLCSVCFTVLLSSHALLSPLYRQLLINSQYWLSYILLALHLTRGVLSLIRPVHLSKTEGKKTKKQNRKQERSLLVKSNPSVTVLVHQVKERGGKRFLVSAITLTAYQLDSGTILTSKWSRLDRKYTHTHADTAETQVCMYTQQVEIQARTHTEARRYQEGCLLRWQTCCRQAGRYCRFWDSACRFLSILFALPISSPLLPGHPLSPGSRWFPLTWQKPCWRRGGSQINNSRVVPNHSVFVVELAGERFPCVRMQHPCNVAL